MPRETTKRAAPKRSAASKTARPPKDHRAYMLRTCDAKLQAHKGFQWPKRGLVEAPDWRPDPECGHGLHGLLWGDGDANLMSTAPEALWLVVEIDARTVVDLGGKVKVPRGWVVLVGTRDEAVAKITALGAPACCFATASAGDGGTASAGEQGILSMRWWDGHRYRIVIGYVGEDGIEAGKRYRCEGGKLIAIEGAGT